MSLHQELTRAGRHLFRWRSWVPGLLLAPVILTVFVPGPGALWAKHGPLWSSFCLFVGAAGLAARVLTVGFVAVDTSGRNTVVGPRAATLNTTGAYSLVRHPLYSANYLLWLAPSLLPGRWWLPVLMTLAYRLFYDRIILAEEEFLGSRFGAQFEQWAEGTPALWPFSRGWRRRFKRPGLRFSIRAAARREYPGLLAFGSAMTAVELALETRLAGALRLSPGWLALFVAVVGVSAVLRFLNHRTAVLAADGR